MPSDSPSTSPQIFDERSGLHGQALPHCVSPLDAAHRDPKALGTSPCQLCGVYLNCIKRDLHDAVANELCLAIRQLELSEAYRRTDPELSDEKAVRAREVLNNLMTTVRRILADVRELQVRVEPAEEDLTGSLTTLAECLDNAQTSVRVEVAGDQARVPQPVRRELSLILRECLLNSLNHAAASRVTATVVITGVSIVAEVEDDGRGFDLSRLDPARHGHGFGLTSISERAQTLGGFIKITTRPGAGTSTRVWIPLLRIEAA
jgi:signal transduction histidine kinase